MVKLTLFRQRVYDVVRKIPKGKTMTYAEVAVAIGQPLAARAVGNALNQNPYSIDKLGNSKAMVPCHRVVRSDGSIGGFASGPQKKINLLKKEGAI